MIVRPGDDSQMEESYVSRRIVGGEDRSGRRIQHGKKG